MKTDINLRTREFEIARGFYLPRFLTIIAVILLLALLAGGTLAAHLYQMKLDTGHEALLQQKEELQVAVAPLDELEAQIRGLERLEGLIRALESDYPPWAASFRKIFSIARDTGPQVKGLAAGDDGIIAVEGNSSTMKDVARLTQALEGVPGGKMALHRSITYPSGDNPLFHYEIELFFVDGGEQ